MLVILLGQKLLLMQCACSVLEQSDTKVMLLVDASSTINSLNHVVALHNIRSICPPISTLLINTYQTPGHLFVGCEALLSKEGATQGIQWPCQCMPLPLYIPLINQFTDEDTQIWFADDAGAYGSIFALCKWSDQISLKV